MYTTDVHTGTHLGWRGQERPSLPWAPHPAAEAGSYTCVHCTVYVEGVIEYTCVLAFLFFAFCVPV